MKVKALTTDSWREKDIDGKPKFNWIEHTENEIYEVVCLGKVGSNTPAYIIKIGDKYGAIKIEDCEIVEGSIDDLNNNIVEHNLSLIL